MGSGWVVAQGIGTGVGQVRQTKRLLDDLEAEFFDDRIGENVFGDAFDLRCGVLAAQSIECQDEKLALADVLNSGIAQRR